MKYFQLEYLPIYSMYDIIFTTLLICARAVNDHLPMITQYCWIIKYN